MDISTLSITELKALAYEQILELQKVQRNIALIEAEIVKRGDAEGTKEAD